MLNFKCAGNWARTGFREGIPRAQPVNSKSFRWSFHECWQHILRGQILFSITDWKKRNWVGFFFFKWSVTLSGLLLDQLQSTTLLSILKEPIASLVPKLQTTYAEARCSGTFFVLSSPRFRPIFSNCTLSTGESSRHTRSLDCHLFSFTFLLETETSKSWHHCIHQQDFAERTRI